jgi:predicted house-cleaning noncanonical NTP pyrophosphatase (MazG superfamily)
MNNIILATRNKQLAFSSQAPHISIIEIILNKNQNSSKHDKRTLLGVRLEELEDELEDELDDELEDELDDELDDARLILNSRSKS